MPIRSFTNVRPAVPQGNGMVFYRDGQWLGRDLLPAWPVNIDNGDGVGGAPRVYGTAGRYMIGKALTLDLTTTDDQPIEIFGPDLFIVRSILFTNARDDAPIAAQGGVYTMPTKAGRALVPAATSFASLTNPRKFLEVTPAEDEAARYWKLYFSLTTPNVAAITLDVYVFADVLRLDDPLI